MSHRVNIIYSRDKDGYYVFCPELPGCQSQGDTFEEARENIKEAVQLYLKTMSSDEIDEMLGKELLIATMEVEIG